MQNIASSFNTCDPSTLNLIALSMVSKKYTFELGEDYFSPEILDALSPEQVQSSRSLGSCKVVGVTITDQETPNLLLLKDGDSDPDYYSILNLDIYQD